jgi:hypothetical protein
MLFLAFLTIFKLLVCKTCINSDVSNTNTYSHCNFVSNNHTQAVNGVAVNVVYCNFANYSGRVFSDALIVDVNIKHSNFFNFSNSGNPLGIYWDTPNNIFKISFFFLFCWWVFYIFWIFRFLYIPLLPMFCSRSRSSWKFDNHNS